MVSVPPQLMPERMSLMSLSMYPYLLLKKVLFMFINEAQSEIEVEQPTAVF